MRTLFYSLAFSISLAGYALAQNAEQSPDTAGKVLVKEGTEVHLKFVDALSSKTAQEDDKVAFVLEEDLKVGKTVVAKEGAKAVGRITNAKKAGAMGKAGELNMRVEYILVGEARVRLRASKGNQGKGKEGTAVALTVLFGPLGLLKKGKDIDIKAGASLKTYVDEDTWLPVVPEAK